MKILVVDDDQSVAQTLQFLFNGYNYAVDTAADGEAGLQMAEAFDYDLILLDLMLPKIDGVSLCQQLRSRGVQSPILLLTGQGESQQKAIALNAGADDYVVKPFDAGELIARVQALLRRGSSTSQPILSWGQLSIDPSSRKVAYGNHLLAVTPKEYAIVELFLRTPQRALSSRAILDHAWTSLESPAEGAVRVHIKELRKKLAAIGAPKDFIKTKHGMGYQLNPLYSSSRTPKTAEQLTVSQVAELRAVNEELRTTLEQVRSTQAQLQQKHRELEIAYGTLEQERQQLQVARDELERRVAELTAELTKANQSLQQQQQQWQAVFDQALFAIANFIPSRHLSNMVNISQRKQVQLTLQRQILREQIIIDISQDIRRSLELHEVLSRTVERVREVLNTDRVIVFRFRPDWQGDVISESVGADWTPILYTTISDPCFDDRCVETYRQGHIATVADIDSEDLGPCYVELLQHFQVRANLVVPILQGDNLWGLLIAHQCSAPRQWEPPEIDLLRQLAAQVGIAIQQSELYEQTRRELLERQRIQTILEESEELFRTLSAAAPIGICQTNADGICLYTNVRWQEMSGLSLEDSLGEGWLQGIHPEDRQALLTAWAASLQGEGECLPECRLLTPEGEIHWVSAKVARMQAATGEIIGYVSIFADITDRKQAELSLNQQLDRQRLLADLSHQIRKTLNLDDILNTAASETRKVLQCDRVFIYSFAQNWNGTIIVESVRDNYPSALGAEIEDTYFRETQGEEYRQGRIQAVANIYTAGLTQCHLDILAQFEVKANLAVPILQEERLWGLLVANQCSAPRQWQSSEIDLLRQLATQLGIAIQQSELYEQTRRELLDRQRMQTVLEENEAALRESEQRLQAVLDNSPAVIYLLDPQNRHLLVNRSYAQLLSTTPENLLGKSIHEVWPAENADVFAANNRQVLETGQLLQTEEVAPHADGLHTYITVKFPLYDAGGTAYALCGISTDITENKRLEQQFYRAQRLESLGTLASGIAHDLNNVLTPILAIAQLLPLKFPNVDERTRELLATLESSAKRGAEMVKQILSFAKGNGGKAITLQVAHLLSEAVRIARRTLPKEIDISAQLPEQDLWLVSADGTQLHQVLMNLIVNARDAMPDGGNLTISAQNFTVDENYARMNWDAHVGPYVAITVADTGTGIPPELRERIFDPFFTTKEVGKGTGLGLATVLGIVKNHGGFIQVSSEMGKGSNFAVYLPAVEGTACQSAPEVKLLKGKGEMILVVDDEAAVRQITQVSLEEYNYRVLCASDGIEAIAIYAQHQDEIKVVLIDLMMPNLDGITAIRTLRKMNPQVKIIATSGLSSQREAALAAGASRFLAKPYTAEVLLKSFSTMDK